VRLLAPAVAATLMALVAGAAFASAAQAAAPVSGSGGRAVPPAPRLIGAALSYQTEQLIAGRYGLWSNGSNDTTGHLADTITTWSLATGRKAVVRFACSDPRYAIGIDLNTNTITSSQAGGQLFLVAGIAWSSRPQRQPLSGDTQVCGRAAAALPPPSNPDLVESTVIWLTSTNGGQTWRYLGRLGEGDLGEIYSCDGTDPSCTPQNAIEPGLGERLLLTTAGLRWGDRSGWLPLDPQTGETGAATDAGEAFGLDPAMGYDATGPRPAGMSRFSDFDRYLASGLNWASWLSANSSFLGAITLARDNRTVSTVRVRKNIPARTNEALFLSQLPPHQPRAVLEDLAWCKPPATLPTRLSTALPTLSGRRVFGLTGGAATFRCPNTEPPVPGPPLGFEPGSPRHVALDQTVTVSTDGGRHWRALPASRMGQSVELIATDSESVIAGFRYRRCRGRVPFADPGLYTTSVAAERLDGSRWRFLGCVPSGNS
jgi:hypothetical protein